MVKTLQRKFIVASMLAVTILLATLVGAINILYCYSVRTRENNMLEMLCETDGQPDGPRGFSDTERRADMQDPDAAQGGEEAQEEDPASGTERTGTQQDRQFIQRDGHNEMDRLIRRGLSMDDALSARFFAVWFDENKEIVQKDTSRIYAVTAEEASVLARDILSLGKSSGVYQDFRYMIREKDSSREILVAMDISRDREDMIRILGISALIAAVCWIAMLLPVHALAKRAIAPTAMSIERQKQFVTNAGHELKTPLAIIQANTEALELYTGESKWTRNIRAQTVRLSGLMQNLLTLSRMDEDSLNLEKKAFALYPLAGEVWENFAEPAAGRNLSFRIIDEEKEEARVLANRESIAQLLSILYDNAVKYTPRGGEIEVRICSAADSVRLIQSNTVSGTEGAKEIAEDPNRLFERFYRTDSDRSRKKGGYGIGLSAARAIAAANSGAISAGIGDGRILFTVTLKKAAREQTS